ncbi:MULTISPECIES: type III restriction-modification system endonuclease [unclassified Halomonas]|uniref:type III restriction-modification system endonuclease n=1 Tax=unclassified Halomonas TaxID=2609666 RepID=UPI00209C6FD5|nr:MULTISPECIES: DEAD/DEAH box helicase family protein [unclassified Halomonas]MCP1314231.1 DEAD/DEAH box helicase family protein [Halomonas sp. 707D7]MCP1325325.1 DEAD/DEAH box helicase family protein [Halomonas sp. 707D4]
MKLKFKTQEYQTRAIEALADCFAGQPFSSGIRYRIDPGESAPLARPMQRDMYASPDSDDAGFKNAALELTELELLNNIRTVQRRQNLPLSDGLKKDDKTGCPYNLDVEMETGTGKTYVYLKSMFELKQRYGWSKFIVVVPSIAIREGVYKSLQITADHFLESYGEKARFFIYNSKQLHNLESFSSDAGISVMVINVQAFNSRGADNRRIYDELDDFQSRRPIDVIKANRPILFLDEPQKMEGGKTLSSLSEFNPLFIVRYSATHKTTYNKIHRLDALDAYNQKLVKKISVHGVTTKGLTGTDAYLYLENIETAKNKPPVALVEYEERSATGVKRRRRKLGKGDNLHELSGGLDQYKGFVVSDIDARVDQLSFTNGVELTAGEVTLDVTEKALRQIQIREAVKAHFKKEQLLFSQGIKVLTLFFIDEVAKYRQYDEGGEVLGEYARIFEEEYNQQLNQVLTLEDSEYSRYLKGIDTSDTHNGYFSIDKKSKRLVDPTTKARSNETDDVDAYDLILKDKERLLSFEEPTRFIFSHSALREGWDNPNVFVICTLKHSDNTISRRQEVGRGLRLAVNQLGERMDDPLTVHDINELTVIASESYKDFVTALQRDISKDLSERPRVADEAYFTGKLLVSDEGEVEVTPAMAKKIHRYLIRNQYLEDDTDRIAEAYHKAKEGGALAALPEELQPYALQVFQLIDSVFSNAQLPHIGDGRKAKLNSLNDNFHKKEFQELWERINRKAAYSVNFDSNELIEKCVGELNENLKVKRLEYQVERGTQKAEASYQDLTSGQAFTVNESERVKYGGSHHSAVQYDLIGRLAEATQLTRRTVATVLSRIQPKTFKQYQMNPEDFMAQAARLINEQKASMVVEHISYDPLNERHSREIFTIAKPENQLDQAYKANRHVYDYVVTDSRIERDFVEELDTGKEVVVYAKLPKSFFIPTPVGNYNPDWAIAFNENDVKHVYFVAETKGSMSSLELRGIEKAKTKCANKFFDTIATAKVTYGVVDSYDKLMDIVR